MTEGYASSVGLLLALICVTMIHHGLKGFERIRGENGSRGHVEDYQTRLQTKLRHSRCQAYKVRSEPEQVPRTPNARSGLPMLNAGVERGASQDTRQR